MKQGEIEKSSTARLRQDNYKRISRNGYNTCIAAQCLIRVIRQSVLNTKRTRNGRRDAIQVRVTCRRPSERSE